MVKIGMLNLMMEELCLIVIGLELLMLVVNMVINLQIMD
jgi:hypothetical protein